MTVKEFKDRLTEELRTKYKKDSRPTPILDRLDLHLKEFEGYDSASIINEKNIQSDVYLSMLLQICYPSRIKMDIDENYQPITKKRIGIISCKSDKKDYACSADEMYSESHLYRAQRNFMIKGYDDYYIISSEYGIIHHSQIIQPYDRVVGSRRFQTESEDRNHGWENQTIKLISDQIGWMVNKQGWDVDFHTSKAYFNPLPSETQKLINYVKQPHGMGLFTTRYNNAYNLLDNNSLEECLLTIGHKESKPKRTPTTWYHPTHPSIVAMPWDIVKKYNSKDNKINDPGLIHVLNGDANHYKGWVIDESHLDNMYQTDSGQWRIKKQK